MYDVEKGHVRIANTLLEDISRLPIPANCLRVLFWAIRNSYGYNRKTTPPTSLRDIADSTKMNKSSAHFSVGFLGKIEILKKQKDGSFFLNKYAIKAAISGPKSSNPLDDKIVQPIGRKPSNPLDDSSNPLDGRIYIRRKDNLKTGGERQGEHPPFSAPRGFSEADLLRVIKTYCGLKKISFKNPEAERVYFNQKSMRESAEKFLILHGGDADRACLCLKDFSEGKYAGKDWNWKFIIEDFPIWDIPRREYERKELGKSDGR